MARERVAITGIGANTSLGGAVSACAAVRARLARPRELPRMAFDAEEGAVPVVGHPVPTVAGFQGEARLLSLAIPALRELVSSTGLDSTAEVALLSPCPTWKPGAGRPARGSHRSCGFSTASSNTPVSGCLPTPDRPFPPGMLGLPSHRAPRCSYCAQGRSAPGSRGALTPLR